jgi:hypothetical protein
LISIKLADENVDVFLSAFLANENIVIFVGCRRKRSYFRRPNFIGGPTKTAIFDGFWPIFVGFWPTKIHYFPVVSVPARLTSDIALVHNSETRLI